MKMLADECCDASLVAALRSDGHDVLYAVELLRGASDDEILGRARDEERILITEDKDFGDLVHRLKQPAPGIILLRFDIIDRELKIPRVRSLLNEHPQQLLGAFVVVDKVKTRFRALGD
jgi:predicted nuclease of predicted toxin-antitoxin system